MEERPGELYSSLKSELEGKLKRLGEVADQKLAEVKG